jgi:hypothetical protein
VASERVKGDDACCWILGGSSSVDDSIHVRTWETKYASGDIDLDTGLNLKRNRFQKPSSHSTLYTTRNEEKAKALACGLSVGLYGGIADPDSDAYRKLRDAVDAAYRTDKRCQVRWLTPGGGVYAWSHHELHGKASVSELSMSGIGEQWLMSADQFWMEKMHRRQKRTRIAVSVFAFDTEMHGKRTT